MHRSVRFLRGIAIAALCALSRHALGQAQPTDAGADVVETIDTAPEPTPSALPRSPPPTTPFDSAAEGERFELHGWARQTLDLGLSKRAEGAATHPATTLPHDQLSARSQLFVRARFSQGRWFEANVSGALSYTLLEGAPADPDRQFNGFNWQGTRGVVEPGLHELFIGFFVGPLDLRIGQQRVAWGNTDFASPNDVVNARDLRDPFLSETELRHLPTLLLRADLDLGFATLQAIVAPAFTPDRYDVYGSNWAGIQPDAPVWARGLANLALRSLDPTLRESAQRLLMATRYPKSDLSQPVLGGRLGWSSHTVDVDCYYQYGFDGPRIRVDPAFATTLAAIDFDHAGLADLEPWLVAVDAGGRPIDASYVRRHHVGMDFATTLGSFAVRLDAAYESKRVFFQRDLLGFVSPTVQGVLSAEYQTGDEKKLALLELLYLRVIDTPTEPLLIYRRNTVGLGADLRWPLWGSLGFALRGLFGIAPRSLVLQPELDLRLERWTLSGGVLGLSGEAYSLGGHFQQGTESYLKLKWSF